ncbi:MAG: hypothetical protein RIT45_1658 [Pseudomonadota bacterium]
MVGLLLLVVGRKLFERQAGLPLVDEVGGRGNAAAGAWVGGQILGLGLAIKGVLFGAEGLLDVLFSGVVGGVLAMLLLTGGSWLLDGMVLHRFDARTEVQRDRNLGTGVVLGAGAVATGLVLDGALSGHSEGFFSGIRDIFFYFFAAQAFLVAAARLFEKIAPFDVSDAIETHDSAAVGFALGGFLVAIGVVVRASVLGAGGNLLAEIWVTLIDGGAGLLLLGAVGNPIAKLLLGSAPGAAVGERHNTAAGVVVGAAYVAVGLVLAGALRPF